MQLPTRMRALVRTVAKTGRPSELVELVERPLPVPERGRVLVRMEAAGCNPSDLAALAGAYAVSPSAGQICGFEGCGRVVAANAGMFGAYLKGKRVALAAPGDGLWAEYAAVPATACLPVGDAMPIEVAAAFIVNPMTAVVLAEMAQKARARAVVLSAGASQLSRGILAILKERGIAAILIVRRAGQVPEMQAAGAAAVLDQSAAGFAAALREICVRLQPNLFLDAVGGALTATVMDALPPGAQTVVYGGLDGSEPAIAQSSILSLIFRDAEVRGFWLPAYLRGRSILVTLRIAREVRRLFAAGIFSTRVAAVSSLEEFPAALDAYAAGMSAGKVFALMQPGDQAAFGRHR